MNYNLELNFNLGSPIFRNRMRVRELVGQESKYQFLCLLLLFDVA